MLCVLHLLMRVHYRWYKYSARNKVLVVASAGSGATTALHAFIFKVRLAANALIFVLCDYHSVAWRVSCCALAADAALARQGDTVLRVARFDVQIQPLEPELLQLCQVYAALYILIIDESSAALRLFALGKVERASQFDARDEC